MVFMGNGTGINLNGFFICFESLWEKTSCINFSQEKSPSNLKTPWKGFYIFSFNSVGLNLGCVGYKWFTETDRRRSFPAYEIKCDRLKERSWYRFSEESGTKMATTCVPRYRCNTHAPSWLNGLHPEEHEGIVTRQVCFHWSNHCCHFTTIIRVRNCGSFYTYELGPINLCHIRYCGEWQIQLALWRIYQFLGVASTISWTNDHSG